MWPKFKSTLKLPNFVSSSLGNLCLCTILKGIKGKVGNSVHSNKKKRLSFPLIVWQILTVYSHIVNMILSKAIFFFSIMKVKFRSFCHSQSHNMRNRYQAKQVSTVLQGSQGLTHDMSPQDSPSVTSRRKMSTCILSVCIRKLT